MIKNSKYRLYGRSKGRGKSNKISESAKKIIIKKSEQKKYDIIDIGVGYGESTILIAKNNKKKEVLACEKYIDGINKIAERKIKSNLKNIKIFHGNVHQFLDEYCLYDSISEIWILFPDPWPKKRHYKRRLIDTNFLLKIKSYLKDQAIIHIASDSKSYISSILLSVFDVRNDYKWSNQEKEEWDYANLSLPKTKYCEKAQEKGLNPFYLKLIKL